MRERLELVRAFARGAGLFVLSLIFLIVVMMLAHKAIVSDRGRLDPCRPGYVRISAMSGYVCIPGYVPGAL